MTNAAWVPVETLIAHAWNLYDEVPRCEYAANLRHAVGTLEEVVDLRNGDTNALARTVAQTLAIATGDEVAELLAPMPGVATFLGARPMTAAVDGWADGYEAARRALGPIPSPMLRAVGPSSAGRLG